MKEKIEQDLRRIILDKFGFSHSDVSHETALNGELGLDSLDKLELILEIENTFKITIGDDEVESLTTFGKLLDLVDNKIESARLA